MTAAETPTVFVSYRRQGTAMHAGRLYDALAARFGEPNVFMDLEMAPGVDFVERITTAVGSCRVLLVVIGPEWLDSADGRAGGPSRLADPQDFVRLEVETALQAADVTVIPVLVGGARMPEPDQLPPELRPLARRNGIEMTDLRWRYDCQRLMSALDELLGERPAVRAASGAPTAPPAAAGSVRTLLPLWLEGVAVAVLAGMLARWAAGGIEAHDPASTTVEILAVVGRRAAVWAGVGAALGLWLSARRGDQGRLVRRTLMGLALGAVAGGLGGVVYALVACPPDPAPDRADLNTISVASLALTGSMLGLAFGALWIPPRALVGLLSGACGGAIVQLIMNRYGDPAGFLGLHRDVAAVGYQCFAIFGLALFAMLALDVRAAAARESPAATLAPEGASA